MNKTFINQIISGLITVNIILFGVILSKIIFRQDINIDYIFAVNSVTFTIVLFEYLLERK